MLEGKEDIGRGHISHKMSSTYLNHLSLGIAYPICLRRCHAASHDEGIGH